MPPQPSAVQLQLGLNHKLRVWRNRTRRNCGATTDMRGSDPRLIADIAHDHAPASRPRGTAMGARHLPLPTTPYAHARGPRLPGVSRDERRVPQCEPPRFLTEAWDLGPIPNIHTISQLISQPDHQLTPSITSPI